jgi:hypothetical protein
VDGIPVLIGVRAAPKGGRAVPSIALIDWSHLLEDLLDHLGVTFETFRDEFMDSWMFGYIAALRVAGVRTVLFWVSARVIQPWRFTHRPTGTPVCTLPAPRAYRAIRRRALNPYAPNVEQAVGSVEGIRYVAAALQKEVAPYFATPIRLLAKNCDARAVRRFYAKSTSTPASIFASCSVASCVYPCSPPSRAATLSLAALSVSLGRYR